MNASDGPCIYIVAAEPSGDALGGDLIDAICRRTRDDVSFFGIGGEAMAARGVASLFDTSELSVLGLVEGIKAYGAVKKRVEEAAQHIAQVKPDALVLIDSWGFMWRVARRVRELGCQTPRIKLIGPQVWATRPGRARTLAENVDHLLCIHSFETPFYSPYGLPTTVVGNPALARDEQGDGSRIRSKYGLSDDTRIIGLLPGSRQSEVSNVSPILESAAAILCKQDDNRIVLCAPAASIRRQILEHSRHWTFRHVIAEPDDAKPDVLAAMDLALACSGTVSTEAALQGAPVVVGYRIGWATWAVARLFLMKSRFITLLNVAADREIAPEFVQTRFTPAKVAAASERLLSDEKQRQTQITAQFDALNQMGRGQRPPAEISADVILKMALEFKKAPPS